MTLAAPIGNRVAIVATLALVLAALGGDTRARARQASPPILPSSASVSLTIHRPSTLASSWVASAAAVIEYATGQQTRDCEVLAAHDRALGGAGLCCTGDPRCMRGAMPRDVETLLARAHGIHARTHPGPIPYHEIVHNTLAGYPIVIWLWRASGAAHVVLAAGYRMPDRVILLDPVSGEQEVDYGTLRQNWKAGVWRETMIVTQARGSVTQAKPAPTPSAIGRVCATQEGACPLARAVPVGSLCTCPGAGGAVPGIAR